MSNIENYTTRSILLLSQLLHINGITTLDKLQTTNEQTIQEILIQWKTHNVTKLDNLQIKINTRDQLIELYQSLLKKYDVDNTVDLANSSYFQRMEQLQEEIDMYKRQFDEILQE